MKNNSKNHKLNNANTSTTYNAQSQYDELEQLQDHLDDLQSDRESMEIVYKSLKNAFLIYPSAELDEIDKEICRAYDDLMAQVRQLDRSLKRLDKSIKLTEQKKATCNSLSPPPSSQQNHHQHQQKPHSPY